MGAHPYWYIVDYEPDIRAVLEKLRQREFKAGRYNPVIRYLEFPITPDSPAPGAQHASIEAAMNDTDADGTRSILDITEIADEPFSDPTDDGMTEVERAFVQLQEMMQNRGNPSYKPPRLHTAAPLSGAKLQQLYGTTKPTRDAVEEMEFFEDIERGTAVYVILYERDIPTEILFAGYSFD